jgi:hypothetical protein
MAAKSKVGEGRKRPKTGGRQAGTPNKATREFRETVTRLLESNSENVGVWLEQVANGIPERRDVDGTVAALGTPGDPAKALDLLSRLAEYAAPKLSRTEVDAKVKGEFSIAEVVKAFHERRAGSS